MILFTEKVLPSGFCQTPHHPAPLYVPENSLLAKKPESRPKPFIVSDDTTTIPPETDQAFPMHMNHFVMERVDDDLEEELEQLDAYDSEQREWGFDLGATDFWWIPGNVGMYYRPKAYAVKSLCTSPSNTLPSGR